MTYGAIVAGAGFAGAVCARILAENGVSVLVLEKRSHIAGNAYDCYDKHGVLIHKYGPHIFHTNNVQVFDFLSRFTDWNGYEHKVLADVYGTKIPVPFNFESLYKAFPDEKAETIKAKLLEKYSYGQNVSILELKNCKEDELKELSKYVYDNIFEKYTLKQWGMSPEEIDPATTARVPVRLSEDCRYFTDVYQGLPVLGYTKMFESMLSHENICVKTDTDCMNHISLNDGKIYFDGEEYSGKFIYTGKIEKLLEEKYGFLPYRTLDFEFETHDCDYFQDCGTVNYTVDKPYTRITEFKHMTLQKHNNTTILKEYSKQYEPHSKQIPYYPVINEDSNALYNKYISNLSEYKNLYLLGRLAEYKYYNMDMAAQMSIQLAERILANV